MTVEQRIGVSGWTYGPWRGTFYPDKVSRQQELHYASRQLNSIEINGTFYALQRPSSYEAWYAATPRRFLFSVKANRYVTHVRRLMDVERPLANFFASGVLALREKMGPILWQFPPSMKFDAKRFETFLHLLPMDTKQALRLAKKHDSWMTNRSWIRSEESRVIRHAIEIRNASFINQKFLRLLRSHGVALVIADSSGKWPTLEYRTADYIYVRLHGVGELYAGGYDDQALEIWAGKIRKWEKAGLDIYVYFDNDEKVRAPFDAMALSRKLSETQRHRKAA